MKRVLGLHPILYSMHNTATDQRYAMSNTPQLKIGHRWLYCPVVYDVYLQPSTTLQNNTPKRAGQNPESILVKFLAQLLLG